MSMPCQNLGVPGGRPAVPVSRARTNGNAIRDAARTSESDPVGAEDGVLRCIWVPPTPSSRTAPSGGRSKHQGHDEHGRCAGDRGRHSQTSCIQGRWMPESTSWSPKARAMPTSSAPTAAPTKLPIPPITTAMNACSWSSAPRPRLTPRNGAAATPPTAASAHPIAKTSVKTWRTLMPSACTISLSCTPARMMMPSRVFFSRSQDGHEHQRRRAR